MKKDNKEIVAKREQNNLGTFEAEATDFYEIGRYFIYSGAVCPIHIPYNSKIHCKCKYAFEKKAKY